MASGSAVIQLPAWLEQLPLPAAPASDEACMAMAIAFARENVARGGGGPFGAVIRSEPGGRIVSAGVNLAPTTGNPVLHAEMVAISLAGSALAGEGGVTLFTSCEPCIMCLGASHWAEIRRIVCAAHREDAEAVGFNEGAGCAELRAEMEGRGVLYERGLMRAEAAEVMQNYIRRGGVIYGPQS
jgi:tRNA(Arg) A34 adenosine deaminase TadA